MAKQSDEEIFSLEKYNELIEVVLQKIKADKTFRPDTILALSTGGFPIAATLSKKLSIKSRYVIGIPVYRDDTDEYRFEDTLLSFGNYSNRQVLIIDDSSKRGLLTKKAVSVVESCGGKAKSCVLISWKEGIQPDYVAEICEGEPPDFFWEY